MAHHRTMWLVILSCLLATQTSAVTDCAFTPQRAYIPIQTFIKNKDQTITVTISTTSDAIIATGTQCSPLPPVIDTFISGKALDEPDMAFMHNQMLSYSYTQGALKVTLKTSTMSNYLTPNFAAYVEVIDAADPKVKHIVCFGIYRYEDASLNDQILMPQSDICADIYCKITFTTVVGAIVSPSPGAQTTVTLASSGSTIKSTGLYCSNMWTISSFAKYADGSLAPGGYVQAVTKTFADPDSGSTLTKDFKYDYGALGHYEITDLQVTISPTTVAQAVAVYVQVYDNMSNLATGWQCFMVNKDSGDTSNFCVDYCSQYDQVFAYSPTLQSNLGNYFVSLPAPIKSNYFNYGYRTAQPYGCPLTHEITSPNAIAQSTAYTVNSLGVLFFKTAKNDPNALSLSGPVSFVLTVKNYAGVVKYTRSLQLTYSGCSSSTIGYANSDPTNLIFFLDPGASAIQPKNTFYIDFSSSDPRCLLSFQKNVVAGVTDAALDATIAINFKDSLKEQNYYFNMTLSQSPLVPASYIGKTYSFDLQASNQDGSTKTIRFNIKLLSCADLPNCQSCHHIQLATALPNSNVKWQTIGCTLCNAGYHGYLYQQSGVITRGCEVDTSPIKEWSQANWGKLYIKNEDTNVVASVDCSTIYSHCQLCSGFGTCLKCDDGFKKSTFTQLASVDLCIKDVCINCATTFPNCQIYNQATAKCLQCKPGYYLAGQSCTERSATPQTQNLFVQQYSNTLRLDAQKIQQTQAHEEDSNVGKSMDNPFFFLGEALSYLNSGMGGLAYLYKSVTANVFLGKGDHHLFFCPNQNLDDPDDACWYVDKHQSWFALFSYPATDNIALTFQPLFCTSKTTWVGLTAAQISWFDANCVSTGTKPTVHVSKGFPMAGYFNITNSATFSNITFSGLQQLQQPGSSNKLFWEPNIYCSVQSEPDGTNKKLGVVSSNQNLLSCADVNFQGDILLQPQCLTITDSDDRPDKSQLYQPNYFSQGNGGQFYIDRVKTLFNLYGFSQMQSTSTKVPALSLANCVFEYFFDYTSLIFVETNQFSFSSQGTFIKQGQDRGFNILISATTVRYSRFLKGAVYYKYDQIARSGGITLYKKNQKQMKFQYFEEQYLYPALALSDSQQLVISNCNFTLLNYGRTEKKLAIAIKPERVVTFAKFFTDQRQFTTYYSNGVGVVLNVQGFQGTIKVSGSVFSKNMIYFSPQITKVWGGSSRFGVPLDQLRSQQYYTLQFCDKYLFNDVLTSYIDHPDQLLFQMEAMSTVLIAFSERLAVFDNNVFSENIGFMGGAILIDSPNFNKAIASLRPNLILYQNSFDGNMAYSSGNAVYMRSTKLTTTSNVCGLIHVEQNTFTRNMAVTKSHNGGAITLACDFVDASDVERIASLSEFSVGVGKQSKLDVQDLLTSATYKTYQYGSGIVNNTFIENVSGQKGTAVYARGVDNLFIVQNSFVRNQPLYSFVESEFLSPLWKYYFQKTRLASWTSNAQVTNEFKYFQLRNVSDEFVELPQAKGAVYIESCEVCLVTYITFDCQICRSNTNTYTEVTNNTFVDNQSGISFSEAQALLKSSQIQISGGNEYYIESNTLSNIGSIYYSRVKADVGDYVNSLPPDYFKYQNAPLIRVSMPASSRNSSVNLRYNVFQNNTGYQSFTNNFAGFLVDFNGSLNSAFVFENNQVRYCRVFGEQVSLLSLVGGVTATNNTFFRIGSIQSKDFSRNATVTAKYYPASLDRSYLMSTQRGLFSIKTPVLDLGLIKSPIYHKFSGNDFKNIFCLQACIYYIKSNDDVHPYLFLFDGNQYRHILAKSSAISFTQALQTRNEEQISQYVYMVQIITNEIYENVQNELHYMEGGQNKVIQIFQNIQSTNNFGLKSLITVKTSDAVFMQDSLFTHRVPYQSRFVAIEASLTISQPGDAILDQWLSGSFYDIATKNWFIGIQQNDGVVELSDNQPEGTWDFPYLNYSLYNNDTVYNYLRTSYDQNVISSNFNRNTFTGHQGKETSLFWIQNSVVSMSDSHFTQNSASPTNGYTFFVQGGKFSGTRLVFGRNRARFGGAIFFSGGSQSVIQNSSFVQNEATLQGGGIYVENSYLVLNWTVFDSNVAVTDSAITVFGSSAKPISISNSIFSNNFAQNGLFSVTTSKVNLSNVTFTDNIAQLLTSGFQIIDSVVIASNITATNTKPMENSAVITGFLFLSSSSHVQILGSTFQNLYGSQAAVALAQGQSKLYFERSTFTGNIVSQSNSQGQKGTIVASQSISVTIVGCEFRGNSNTNVNSDKTALVVVGSRFYDKNSASDSYIQIFGQSLQVSNSDFQASNSYLSKGSAIFGDSLPNLQVTGCVFQNLHANQGGSVFLKFSSNAEFVSNTFQSNSATQGGGVYIQASNAKMHNNLFYNNFVAALPTKNKSKATSQSEGAGGAIYFSCVDQSAFESLFQAQNQATRDSCSLVLNGNVLSSNTASNKGGAVFIANKNVTLGQNANTFVNNMALYGNVFAYAPASLNFTLPESPFLKQDPGIHLLFGRRLDQGSIYLQIVSGGLFSFNTTIQDQLQSQYLDDSISTAQLIFVNKNLGSIINGRQIAVQGQFNFQNVEVRIKPDSMAILMLQFNSLSNYGNNIPFIESPVRLYIYARPCIAGEMYTDLLTCRECEFGTYLLVPQTEEGQCQPCFQNAICYGGNRVSPNQGYYRFNVLTPVVEKCPNFEACLGGSQSDLRGLCASGYSGALCAQCAPGYFQRIDAFVCFQCFEMWAEILIWLCSLAVCIGIICWIQKQFIRNFQEAGNTTLTIFKIGVTHMQMIMMLSKIGDFKTNSFVEIFLWAKITLLELYLRIVFPQCLLQSMSGETKFYVEISLMALLPVLLFLASYLFWLIYSRAKEPNQDRDRTFSRAVSTTSLLLFIYYPFVIESVLTSVSCQNSQEENWDPESTELSHIQRLRVRPDIKCFHGTHSWFMWVVCVPAIIMWVIVFPFLLSYKMHTNQKLIVKNFQPLTELRDDGDDDKTAYDDSEKRKQEKIDQHAIVSAKSRYGLLFLDFKLVIPQQQTDDQLESDNGEESLMRKLLKLIQKILQPISDRGLEIQHPEHPKDRANSFYYWELIIYLRKIVLCLIVIVGRQLEQQIQLNLLLVTFVVFVVIQTTAKPYQQQQANKLELLSLLVGLGIVYIRMVMLSKDQEENIKQQTFNMFSSVVSQEQRPSKQSGEVNFLSVVSMLLIVGATITFDSLWLQGLRHELLVYLAEKNHGKSFKMFTCGMIKMKKFRDQHVKVGKGEQEEIFDRKGEDSLEPEPKLITVNSQREEQGDANRMAQYQADEIEIDGGGQHDSHRRLMDDSGAAQLINPNQIGILGNQSHLISSARKGVQPVNLFRHQSDRSMNRPFYEDSQSHQQVMRELRTNKSRPEVGGTSENFSQSNSINTNTIGTQLGHARTARALNTGTNQLKQVRLSQDNESSHSQDIQSHVLSARKRENPIQLQLRKQLKKHSTLEEGNNNKRRISASQEIPVESSSGEFTWEDISTERNNDDKKVRPGTMIGMVPVHAVAADEVSSFKSSSLNSQQ